MRQAASWQRFLLAGFSLTFLVLGAVLAATKMLDVGSSEYISGTLLKVGFVLGLAWLAAPQLERLGWDRLRGTMLVALIFVLVLTVIRPRLGAVAIAIFAAGTLLIGVTSWIRQFVKPS